ncbi:MAG: HAMP domain-containing histidine kinase [Thermoleophilia bacterium]|nr:HAMP domain-containing histidine kinase [Thermoleophilia bacterium]
MSRPGHVWRSLGRGIKRAVIGDSPSSLHATIFRVVFAAVAVPVVIATLGHYLLSGREEYEPPDRQLLDACISSGALVMPDGDYEQMKEIVLADAGSSLSGILRSRGAWPPDAADSLFGAELPASAYEELIARGYAFGDTVYTRTGEEARFAVWRVPEGTPTGIERESYMSLVMVPRPMHGRIVEGLVVFGVFCLLVAAIASPAAGYLVRRIARPVGRVAEASRVVAEGGHPLPVPVKGPDELRALGESFNDMAAKLEGAQAAEQEARAVEREFLMSVSHELKTPLTTIDGYAELLSEGAVDAQEAGPVLTAEAARLRRLVSDLLDLAKIRQSSFTVREAEVHLDVVAAEVVRRHATRARELGAQLVALTSGAGKVRADEDRLIQAVSNLVENALRCVPNGGLVTVETGPDTVVIRDDGPGIAAQDLPHVFERFYLHDRLKSDHDIGTGLGLAIVKELVERMGGEVSVESELGKGAVFSLKLRPFRAVNDPI